jgi:hypothetical protein
MNKKLKTHLLTVLAILFLPAVLLGVLYYATNQVVRVFTEKDDE